MKTNQANSTTAQAGKVYFSTWKEVEDFMAFILFVFFMIALVVGMVVMPFYYINRMNTEQAELDRTYQLMSERGLR